MVPGWAFDHRVFAGLELPFNYHLFCGPSLSAFEDEVMELAATLNALRVSLLGWSKGAFAVCAFATQHPELVAELFLVGARRKYEPPELEAMRASLQKNKAACLKRFYRQCFAKEEMAQYQWFKNTLLRDYLETLPMELLAGELDWLGQAEIRPADLERIETVKFIHGASDAIAPIEQVTALVEAVPQSELIAFEQTGHAPFLRDDFARRIHGD
jgi:pimeloyl-ACP methyl ester carboxylesterase